MRWPSPIRANEASIFRFWNTVQSTQKPAIGEIQKVKELHLQVSEGGATGGDQDVGEKEIWEKTTEGHSEPQLLPNFLQICRYSQEKGR